MQLTIIVAIFIGIAGVVFAMQNNVPVTVTFMLWRFDSSLAMVLLSAVAVGAIVVALLTTPGTVRRQWQATRQKRRIEDLEKDNQFQKGRIAELEKSVPAAAGIAASAPPYVGLKELVMSRQSDAAGDEDKPGG